MYGEFVSRAQEVENNHSQRMCEHNDSTYNK